MKPVILDCTELYRNPVRTGIQRVVREMLRHWPTDGPELHVARFETGKGLLPLPASATRLLMDHDPDTAALSHDALTRKIHRAAAADHASPLPGNGSIFLPEVFYDPKRCQYYVDRIKSGTSDVSLLSYDFIPILYPWIFNLSTAVPFMNYLRLVQNIPKISHISRRTQDEYARRVMRGGASSEGTVLALGADGLPTERQYWRPDRQGFLALGSFDGWKNQNVILAAFLKLWEAGHNVPLTLIGRAYDGVDISWMVAAKGFGQFRWLSNASDADIANEMSRARGTIYIPALAGFGLPPIESLYAGIPVITLADMPSLDTLEPNGQLRLSAPDPDELAAAVLTLQDDKRAAELWAQTAELRLATWRDFAAATAAWLARA